VNPPRLEPIQPPDEGRIAGHPSSWQRVRLIRRASLAVCFLLLIAGIMLLADDYGQSWDDYGDARFGAASLKAYIGDPGFLQGHGDRLYYGPIYFMLSQAAVGLGQVVAPGILAVDVRHALNAATLVLAGAALYWLAMRLTLSPSAAIVAVILFGLQPVVFGHAFINQKDIPFMAFFTLAVATGIMAVDASRRTGTSIGSLARTDESVPVPTVTNPSGRLMVARAAVVLAGVVLLVDLLRWGLPYQALRHLLSMAYAQTGPSWLNGLFRAVAQDAYKTPFPLYLQKLSLAYAWTSIVLGLILLAGLVLLTVRWLPPAHARGFQREVRAGLTFAGAGVALGICTSTRALGPFAGALVLVYALMHPRRRTMIGLGAYLCAGAVSAYLAWPFLWGAPIAKLMAATQLMLGFYPHIVLFNLTHYTSTDLPRSYLPWLLAVQLTETALIGLAAGTAIALRRLWRRHPSMDLLIVILGWSLIPLAYAVLFRPSIYGNFRQFLFILPPLFLLAGLAIDLLFNWVRRRPMRVIVILLLLAPGLLGILRLHPYEYVYYNNLIGGPQGAIDRYQLDYWCTSYRDAMAYVNEHAREGALVAVHDPLPAARTFARPDLRVDLAPTREEPDFALVCDEQHMMDGFYPGMKTVFVVMADGVALAEVKQHPPGYGTEAAAP
jgi:hypothetical protein